MLAKDGSVEAPHTQWANTTPDLVRSSNDFQSGDHRYRVLPWQEFSCNGLDQITLDIKRSDYAVHLHRHWVPGPNQRPEQPPQMRFCCGPGVDRRGDHRARFRQSLPEPPSPTSNSPFHLTWEARCGMADASVIENDAAPACHALRRCPGVADLASAASGSRFSS